MGCPIKIGGGTAVATEGTVNDGEDIGKTVGVLETGGALAGLTINVLNPGVTIFKGVCPVFGS